MNVTLPKKEKISKKTLFLYFFDLLICVFAIAIIFGILFLGDDVVDSLFGVNKITQRSSQEEDELKSTFEQIFDNSFEVKTENNVRKIKNDKDIVYTNYSKSEKQSNYELDVNIPYVNIKSDDAIAFNEEIDKTFKNKAEEVIKYSGSNNIYTVKYKAYMENNILSLIIYSDLKQGTSAQRVIYETFTYDLKQNKKLTLQETLSQFSLKTQDIQSKINSDIKAEEEKNLDLKNLGYNVFTRDINNSIYKVENINEFFVYNGNIYIIFAYGNEQFTSQKDIVVI